MPQVELWTYHDIVDHLLRDTDENTRKRALINVRMAAADAYREIAHVHPWSYLQTKGSITTVAPYSTSTVTYIHTGSTYERELTLLSGTWPTWAAQGTILISGRQYRIEDRKSATVLTLTVNNNPGADISTATSYTLFQDTYPLPLDFTEFAGFVDVNESLAPTMVSDQEWLYSQQGNQEPSTPLVYCIQGSPEHFGTHVVRFSPPPDAVRVYDFIYRRMPRPLVIDLYDTGRVATSSGSTTITGTGTAFTSDMEGSVIRISSTSAAPTGVYGTNRFAFQRIIHRVASATSLTVDSPISTTLSGVGFQISDPLDIDINTMLNAYLRLCEAQHGTLRAWNPGGTTEDIKVRSAERRLRRMEYEEALRSAKEANNRSFEITVARGYSPGYPGQLSDYATYNGFE